MALQNAFDGLATEPKQDDAIVVLANLLTELQTQQKNAVTDAELRSSPLGVADRDTTLEVLPDQQADGLGFLTFTFSAEASPWVHADGNEVVRVTGPGQAPSLTLGVPIPAGSPFPLPFVTTEVRVWATAGQAVTVYGTR